MTTEAVALPPLPNAHRPPAGAARYPHAWLWPVGLVTLLCGSIGICVTTAIVAARDPSFALEPDYYEQAVSWDESARARDASRALGLVANVQVSDPIDASGVRTLTVRLHDAAGDPVPADRLEVIAFHHARRREPITLQFGTGSPAPAEGAGATLSADAGCWTWSLGPARAGMWQVRIRASRGPSAFIQTLDLQTPDGGR